MLLENKVALVYGAGPIGGAVARAFAREGARVFVANRTQARLDRLAEALRTEGLALETAMVDALDEQAVESFVSGVATQAGRVDISFNLISLGDVQEPLMQIGVDDFLHPVATALRAHFLTTRAAARQMIKSGGGVILLFGGGGPQTLPGLGGFKIALDAMEGLRRQWAVELGAQGIRVVTLKTGGVPETVPASMPESEAIIAGIEQATLLKRAATLADVGAVAAFVASDRARMITATEVNISGGAIIE
jgi:3-oxoacyl-[acyl-carrier protein] reductase